MPSWSGLIRRVPLQGRKRALAKTILYRTLMIAITIGVSFAVTRDVTAAVNIGIATNALKTLTYYGYERLWDHLTWGLSPEHHQTKGGPHH